MNRRTYLGLVGTTVGLSGCTGGGDQPRTDTDTTEPRTQGPTPQTAVETTVDNVSEGPANTDWTLPKRRSERCSETRRLQWSFAPSSG